MAKRTAKATKRAVKKTVKRVTKAVKRALVRGAKSAKSPRAAHAADSVGCEGSASQLIDARIAEYSDWRGARLAQVRRVVLAALPNVVEEWKWRVPVWSCGGIVCTGEVYREVVKVTFALGAALDDRTTLFNASLAGSTRRAIDMREDDVLDEKAFAALVRAAAELRTRGHASGRQSRARKS